MIYIDNISFHYHPDRWVFSNLSLTINHQTWNIVAGPEGSGKSTLAKLIKGILSPQIGKIYFSSKDNITSEEIGYISGDQCDSVVGVTVLDDICFGMENLCMSRREMHKRLEKVLAWTELQGYENRLTHTLSGGELQKLSLAGVLATGSKALILDEAFSMLDALSRRNARKLIKTLKEKLNLTIIEITNRSKDIDFADTVTFLNSNGKALFYESTSDFLSSDMGTLWISPQGGIHSLLNSFPAEDRFNVRQLLESLNINLT